MEREVLWCNYHDDQQSHYAAVAALGCHVQDGASFRMVVVDLNRSVLEQQPRNIQLIVFHSFMEGGSSLVVCDVRQPLIAFKKVPNNFCMPSACGRVQTSYASQGALLREDSNKRP
eukprot:3441006-Amphidinium_carterae.1